MQEVIQEMDNERERVIQEMDNERERVIHKVIHNLSTGKKTFKKLLHFIFNVL